MKRFLYGFVLILLLLAVWAPAGKLTPSSGGIAVDVACTGCVATADILDDTIVAADVDETSAFAWSSATNTFVGATYTGPTADSADAGVVRLANLEQISWEKSPTGTDAYITVDGSNDLIYSDTDSVVKLGVGAATGLVLSWQHGVESIVAASGERLVLQSDVTVDLDVTGGVLNWSVASTALKPGTNNSEDLGTSSAAVKNVYIQGSLQSANTKTLTETTATSFVSVFVASGSFVGGIIEYVIHANDATDFQARSGEVNFAAVNKAGTETCTLGTVLNEAIAESTGASTLTNSFTCVDGGTNLIAIQANATSSLTQTTLAIKYRVHINSGTATVTGL